MSQSTFTYLDKAINQLRDLGLTPSDTPEAPIVKLIQKLSSLDETRALGIARTLNQASTFNEVVREQVGKMTLSNRYEELAANFNSIRADAKNMVKQIEDGRIDTFEKIGNVWMKVTRGDIASRFDDIKKIYLDVAKESNNQIERERIILNAYQDFRGAMKEAEIFALEILKQAETQWNSAKETLNTANQTVSDFTGEDLGARAKLELSRDEALRQLQFEEDRYQIAKDLADNLAVSYNSSEVVMARLLQTTNAKERVYKQSITFFGTNETVLTALTASFTGLFGLHESTQTLEAMKDGVSQSLEDLADIGGKVQEAAIRAGYGPTIRAESIKKLVDSVVEFQERSREIINEMRTLSTKNADEIREAVETGKQRLAKITQRGERLVLPVSTTG